MFDFWATWNQLFSSWPSALGAVCCLLPAAFLIGWVLLGLIVRIIGYVSIAAVYLVIFVAAFIGVVIGGILYVIGSVFEALKSLLPGYEKRKNS
jgi:hypothetical protein